MRTGQLSAHNKVKIVRIGSRGSLKQREGCVQDFKTYKVCMRSVFRIDCISRCTWPRKPVQIKVLDCMRVPLLEEVQIVWDTLSTCAMVHGDFNGVRAC